MVIRSYRDGDLGGVIRCFGESVRVIAGRHYDAQQIAVWAPAEPDREAWRRRLSIGGVLVADVQGSIAGFARVEASGFIDLLYVDPSYERRGIGKALLEAACAWSASAGAGAFEANVSLAARALFERAGFQVEREQAVEHGGAMFRNFRMRRERGVVPAAWAGGEPGR